MREDVRTNGNTLQFYFPAQGRLGKWMRKKCVAQKGANYSCTLTAIESVLLHLVALLSVSVSARQPVLGPPQLPTHPHNPWHL